MYHPVGGTHTLHLNMSGHWTGRPLSGRTTLAEDQHCFDDVIVTIMMVTMMLMMIMILNVVRMASTQDGVAFNLSLIMQLPFYFALQC